MVSRVLNVRIFALACLVSVLTWTGCSRDNAAYRPDKATQELIEHCRDVLRPAPCEPLSDERRIELEAVYCEILRDYRARDIQALRDWERRLPKLVAKDGGDALRKLEEPVSRILFETFTFRPDLVEYANATNFIRDTESEIALARIWGDSRRARKEFGTFWGELDARVYLRLAAYRQKFTELELVDCERHASKLMREWCARIDSDEGYTKTLMDYRIAKDMLWGWKLMDEMNITWDAVVSSAVQQTTAPLVRAGYRPKWMGDYDHVPEPNWKEVKAWCRKGMW